MSLVGLIKCQVLTKWTNLPQTTKLMFDSSKSQKQTSWELLTMPGPKVGHWGTWHWQDEAWRQLCVPHKVQVTWKSGSQETGERTRWEKDRETWTRNEMMQEHGADRRGKGGQREAEIRESTREKNQEEPRHRQVRSWVSGAVKGS